VKLLFRLEDTASVAGELDDISKEVLILLLFVMELGIEAGARVEAGAGGSWT
jgi:hypothetical protein